MSSFNYNTPPTVIKPSVNRKNLPFEKAIFYIYMPAMEQFVETEQGALVYTEYVKIANTKCFSSMWGDEWAEGMSLLIAHYLTLWAERAAMTNSSMSKTVQGIAAMGRPRGVQTSISAGELSKSFDFSLTTLPTEKDNAFYNKTAFGQDYYARLIQKRSITMAVVI
jgi:hypothetical protein